MEKIRKKKIASENEPLHRSKRFKQMQNENYIDKVPDELLLNIFKNLPIEDVWTNMRLVCKRWSNITKSSCLWKKVKLQGHKIPLQTVIQWLKTAKYLKELHIYRRFDVDEILKEVLKNNKCLEKLYVIDCWGEADTRNIRAHILCSILKRCSELTDINLNGTKFTSCKFYRLLALCKGIAEKPFRYTGYASPKQVREFLLAREEAETDYISVMNVDYNHSWELSREHLQLNSLEPENQNPENIIEHNDLEAHNFLLRNP